MDDVRVKFKPVIIPTAPSIVAYITTENQTEVININQPKYVIVNESVSAFNFTIDGIVNAVTFKNYYAMKKTMYLTSIMVTAFMILFSLFKIFHLPGAGALFVITVVLFSSLFLPLVILIKLKDESKKTEKMVYSFGFLLGISTSIGVLFKLMHWPYAGILMLSGVSIFTFIYVPLYYITQSRTTKDKYQTILLSILMFTVGGLMFALFDLKH
jgi:uncharacterized membrane protein